MLPGSHFDHYIEPVLDADGVCKVMNGLRKHCNVKLQAIRKRSKSRDNQHRIELKQYFKTIHMQSIVAY